jgi:uncharacterized protein (DUF924 family)
MVKAASRHAALHRNRAIVRGTPRVHEADARVISGKADVEIEEVLDVALSDELRSSP